MPSRIYLSAVESELSEARAVATHLLRKLGYWVVYEEGFEGEGDWREMIQERIARCDGVLQLVGQHYGVTSPEDGYFGGPLSYTQYEGEFARRTGRRVGYLLLGTSFTPERLAPPSAGERGWQEAYRRQVERSGRQMRAVARMEQLEGALRALSGVLFSQAAGSGKSAAVPRSVPPVGAAARGGDTRRLLEDSPAGGEGKSVVAAESAEVSLPRYTPRPEIAPPEVSVRARRSFVPLHDKLPEFLQRALPTWLGVTALLIFGLVAFNFALWKAIQANERPEGPFIAEAKGTAPDEALASSELTGRPASDAGAASLETREASARPSSTSSVSRPSRTGRPNDLLVDPSGTKVSRWQGASRPSPAGVEGDALLRYLPGGAAEEQGAILSAFRAFPLRMLDEPVSAFDTSRFLARDDALKRARAIAELAADSNLPVGTLERRLKKLAEDLLASSGGTKLERARALFIVGNYKEAEEMALGAVPFSAGIPQTDFFPARILAAASAKLLAEDERTTKHLEMAARVAEARRFPLELALVDQLRGAHLLDAGKSPDAYLLLDRARLVLKTSLGSLDPIYLRSQHDLGVALLQIEKYAEARAELLSVVQAYTAQLGPDHPRTLMSEHNLAAVIFSQDDPAAEESFRRVAARRAKVLGDDHPDTLRSNCFLASALTRTNKDNAVALHESVIERARRVRGENDPITIFAMRSLGKTLALKGDLERREMVLKEIARLLARRRGQETAEMMSNLEDLGALYLEREKYREAQDVYQDILEVSTRVRGKEHSGTLLTMSNLAKALAGADNFSGAESLYRSLFAIQTRLLGESHAASLRTLLGLGSCLNFQKKYDAAVTVLEKVVGGAKALSKAEVIDAAQELGLAHYGAGNHGAAARQYQWVLAILDSLKADAVDTYRPLSLLFGLLVQTGEFEEALRIGTRAFGLEKELPELPETERIDSRHLYGVVLSALGKSGEAVEYLRFAAEGRARLLGPENPETLASRVFLTEAWLASMASNQVATPYQKCRELFLICDRVLGANHEVTLRCARFTATYAAASGDLAQAATLFGRLVEHLKSSVGKYHLQTAEMADKLAVVLERRQQYAEAGSSYALAEDGYKKNLESNSLPACLCSIGVARCLYYLRPVQELESVRDFVTRRYNAWRETRGDRDHATMAAAQLLAILPRPRSAR